MTLELLAHNTFQLIFYGTLTLHADHFSLSEAKTYTPVICASAITLRSTFRTQTNPSNRDKSSNFTILFLTLVSHAKDLKKSNEVMKMNLMI